MRAEAWEKTADCLESGYTSDDSFVGEECNDASEARNLARHYRAIITEVKKQVREQGDW